MSPKLMTSKGVIAGKDVDECERVSRGEVLSRVKAGTLSVQSAGTVLAVSYRQAKRLRRYRAEGRKGLKHRRAGGASNHARPTAERAHVLVSSCGRNTAGRWMCGSGRRWPPSISRAKTASRCITTPCGGGC